MHSFHYYWHLLLVWHNYYNWWTNIDICLVSSMIYIRVHSLYILWRPTDFWHGAKTIQRRKNSFSNKWCWINWISTCKRMSLDSYLITHTKLYRDQRHTWESSNGRKAPEWVVVTLIRWHFSDMTPKAQTTKETRGKLNIIKIKNLLWVKIRYYKSEKTIIKG